MTSDNTFDDGSIGPTDPDPSPLTDEGIDCEKAQEGVQLLLDALGKDLDSERLDETWRHRAPNAFETLTEGKRKSAKPTMRTVETTNNSLVIKTGIPIYSLCEHHLLPDHGRTHVAYRPNGEAAGLSKLTRYVRWQSRRLTMQEQLTQDIAMSLMDELGVRPVLIQLTATHLCEAMHGVETASETTIRATGGDPTKTERTRFQQAVGNSWEES